jgi:isoquinoline 1-oxidoreductase alpha subunit
MIRLNINGKTHDVDVDPNTPLLWAIREQVGLTGTKYGCGVAQCGACTVHIDGAPIALVLDSCRRVAGARITTIEGLAAGGTLTKVQSAWIEHECRNAATASRA